MSGLINTEYSLFSSELFSKEIPTIAVFKKDIIIILVFLEFFHFYNIFRIHVHHTTDLAL